MGCWYGTIVMRLNLIFYIVVMPVLLTSNSQPHGSSAIRLLGSLIECQRSLSQMTNTKTEVSLRLGAMTHRNKKKLFLHYINYEDTRK
jgi:hypothetical protein